MALQTSGKISHADIKGEFGGSGAIGLSDYYGAASGIPTSGTIKESDFYGKSAAAAVYDPSVVNFPNNYQDDGGSYIEWKKSYSSKPIFGNTTTNWNMKGMAWPFDEQEGKIPDNADRYWAWKESKISQYMQVNFSSLGKSKPYGSNTFNGAARPYIVFSYASKKGDNGYVQGNINEMRNVPMNIDIGGANITSDGSKIVWHLTSDGKQGTGYTPDKNGYWEFIGTSGQSYGRLNVTYDPGRPQGSAQIAFPVSEGGGKIQYNGWTYSGGSNARLFAEIRVNKVEFI